MTMKFGFGQPLTTQGGRSALARGRALHRRCVAGEAAACRGDALAARPCPVPYRRSCACARDAGRASGADRRRHSHARPAADARGVCRTSRSRLPTYPILAKDVVRHVGDAVAFVVADSLDAAKDAAEAVEIDWQTIAARHRRGRRAEAGRCRRSGPTGRAISLSRPTLGDAGATKEAFAKAAHIVELTIVNQRLVTNYLDTRGVVAEYDGERYHADARQPGQPHHPRHHRRRRA